MQKYIRLLLLLFCFQTGIIKSQTDINIGLKVGANFSKWTINQPVYDKERNMKGFTISVPVEFQFNPLLGLQTELCFIQKGVVFESNDNTASLKVILNYFEVPVLAKITTGKKLKLTINVGPSVAYAVGGKIKSSSRYYPTSESEIDFNRDQFNHLDAGVLMGAGIKAPILQGFFTLDFRYFYGLMDISTEPDNSIEAKNKGFSFMAGYLFPINKKKNKATIENKS